MRIPDTTIIDEAIKSTKAFCEETLFNLFSKDSDGYADTVVDILTTLSTVESAILSGRMKIEPQEKKAAEKKPDDDDEKRAPKQHTGEDRREVIEKVSLEMGDIMQDKFKENGMSVSEQKKAVRCVAGALAYSAGVAEEVVIDILDALTNLKED